LASQDNLRILAENSLAMEQQKNQPSRNNTSMNESV
jgi:hypothetical protein